MQGPSGPHLFRNSSDSTKLKESEELELLIAMSPRTAQFENIHRNISLDSPQELDSPTQFYIPAAPPPQSTVQNVKKWSAQDVANWLVREGYGQLLADGFLLNHISGRALLSLGFDELIELDVPQEHQHRLQADIEALNRSVRNSNASFTPVNQPMSRQNSLPLQKSQCVSPISPANEETSPTSGNRRRRPAVRRQPGQDDITPLESVSIVAIEQILPKLHVCSKGENCSKWQKQQRKYAKLAKEFNIDIDQLLAGREPASPEVEQHAPRPKSDAEPSVVASSDVLGPGPIPTFTLSPETLSEIKPRDPQENVRHFLDFQHIEAPNMSAPASPPKRSASKRSVKDTVPLAQNLRALPKLTIPDVNEQAEYFSPHRTATPSFGRRAQQMPVDYSPFTYGNAISPADVYRHETPFSEMDVPVTAIPIGPVARETSQSVPPDMRYGNLEYQTGYVQDPICRSNSTRPAQQMTQHRRHPFYHNQPTQGMTRLDEYSMSPVQGPDDLTPRPGNASAIPFIPPPINASQAQGQASLSPTDANHAGWMKKRKTKLLRHEWQDHHFTLRGTRLAMYKDEEQARRDSKALEYIDVDDYAVACSSVASSSKLTAAFKKSILKNTSQGGSANPNEAAFAFSLVPAGSDSSKRQIFERSGKSHHFAVRTRDERIDWMRELMLAKALKKGREDGGVMRVNGNMI